MTLGLPVGSKVRVKAVVPEDAVVAAHLMQHVGKIGVVQTPPDISGDQWVAFSDGGGGIFNPQELEAIK